jgi:hypothetical protein
VASAADGAASSGEEEARGLWQDTDGAEDALCDDFARRARRVVGGRAQPLEKTMRLLARL